MMTKFSVIQGTNETTINQTSGFWSKTSYLQAEKKYPILTKQGAYSNIFDCREKIGTFPKWKGTVEKGKQLVHHIYCDNEEIWEYVNMIDEEPDGVVPLVLLVFGVLICFSLIGIYAALLIEDSDHVPTQAQLDEKWAEIKVQLKQVGDTDPIDTHTDSDNGAQGNRSQSSNVVSA